MENDKFKELVSQIDGLLSEETCFLLYSLVGSLSHIEADILEIGAYKGRVSLSFALAIKEAQKNYKVYSLDTDYFNTKKEFLNNIEKFGFKDIIIPIFKMPPLVNIRWKRPLKFIFIDTDGNYFSAKCDFILWERFLLKGGIVALSCAHSSGIKRFFKECIECSGRFSRYKNIDDILLAYKERYTKTDIYRLIYIRIIYIIYILVKKLFYRLRQKKAFRWLNRTYLKKNVNIILEYLLK